VPLKLNDVIVQVYGAEVRDISRIEAIFAQGDHSARIQLRPTNYLLFLAAKF
jgi:hypothetical protein